jgi:2'-5' RNA ligase
MFFLVDGFYLVESKLKKEGPEYTELEKYNLN